MLRGLREQTDPQDLTGQPASASELHLLTWKVEPRTGGLCPKQLRGQMAVSPFPDPITPCPLHGTPHHFTVETPVSSTKPYAPGGLGRVLVTPATCPVPGPVLRMWGELRKCCWMADVNGDIKYLEWPTLCLKHHGNSVTGVATIKISLLIFPSSCCALVGRGSRGTRVLGELLLCGLR